MVVQSKTQLSEKLLLLHKNLTQAMNYRLLLAHNALSRLRQHAVFVRAQDSIARRQQRVDDLVYRLAQAQSRLDKNLLHRVESLNARLRHHDMRVRLGDTRRQLESLMSELETSVSRLVVARSIAVERLAAALFRASETGLLRRRSRWERLQSGLQALSPRAILDRGYALVFDSAGHLVKEATQLKPGDEVRAQLAGGQFTAEVGSVSDEQLE
jgi:exodeoxyribonuclease VII large subunit